MLVEVCCLHCNKLQETLKKMHSWPWGHILIRKVLARTRKEMSEISNIINVH